MIFIFQFLIKNTLNYTNHEKYFFKQNLSVTTQLPTWNSLVTMAKVLIHGRSDGQG